MGEQRRSSGPPGRESLTFSADETLEDGTKVRTLETPAATIRFCFIDNISSESDSEEYSDNVEPVWKPPDSTFSHDSIVSISDVDSPCSPQGEMNVGVELTQGDKEHNMVDKVESTLLESVGITTDNGAVSQSLKEDEAEKGGSLIQTLTSEVDDVPHSKADSIESKAEVDFKIQNGLVTLQDESNSDIPSHNENREDPEPTESHNIDGASSPSDRPSVDTSSGCPSPLLTSMPRSPRFNPFDRDVFVDEDHFHYDRPQPGSLERRVRHSLPNVITPITRARTSSEEYPRSISSSDDSGFLVKDENDVSFADLGLTEDHFSQPEGFFGLSTTEELELAIESCKEMIMEAGDNLEKKKNLVSKLVQLRIRLQDTKEGPEEMNLDADTKLVLGHKFTKKDTGRSKHYCEKCNNVIWGMLQVWYRCAECGFCCHGKCLNLITRMCASIKVAENPSYILSICPEKGLAAQQYRCAECRTVISFKNSYDEPRQCDYTGGYYCEQCHWNDTMVIPARVLHNWDFEPMKVCRASKQFLKLIMTRSVIRIQDINPMLFSFIEELNEVKKLREEILVMKKYFLSCQEALNSKLLLQLQDRQHFVDNSDMYSMQDLLDIASDELVPKLTKIHASFAQHIKADCELCQVKGFICELCDSQEILFPFDNHAIVCSQCSAVLHRHCYMRRDNTCPRCERRNRRATEDS